MEARSYPCQVEEVHSGDDLIAMVDLGVDRLFKRVRLRLQGVDTPNAYRAKTETEAGILRDEVKKLTAGRCRAELVSEGKGGWLVVLFAEEPGTHFEVNVNDLLKGRGFVYRGRLNGASNNDTAYSPGSTSN
jgi:hypothetical protein